MYKTVNLKFTGVSPLLMHSSVTVDPTNKFSRAMKEISGKRKKVDADYEEMARIEYMAGLYVQEGKVVLPSYVIEASLVSGAKKSKSGMQAKSGLFVDTSPELIYNGPTDPKELFADDRFKLSVPVKVGTARIIRTRPMFKHWSCDVQVSFMEDVLNERQVIDFAEQAGMLCGVGDWRPKFGRFSVTKI